MRIKYQNSGIELLGRTILWVIGTALIITIPWVINDIITYFAKGFQIVADGENKGVKK